MIYVKLSYSTHLLFSTFSTKLCSVMWWSSMVIWKSCWSFLGRIWRQRGAWSSVQSWLRKNVLNGNGIYLPVWKCKKQSYNIDMHWSLLMLENNVQFPDRPSTTSRWRFVVWVGKTDAPNQARFGDSLVIQLTIWRTNASSVSLGSFRNCTNLISFNAPTIKSPSLQCYSEQRVISYGSFPFSHWFLNADTLLRRRRQDIRKVCE